MKETQNWHFTKYKQFFSLNTGNAIKIFDAGLKMMQDVPEKHVFNFLALRLLADFL